MLLPPEIPAAERRPIVGYRFSTIVSKYPGECARCQEPIPAGTRVRYNGRLWHYAAECPGSEFYKGAEAEAPKAKPRKAKA